MGVKCTFKGYFSAALLSTCAPDELVGDLCHREEGVERWVFGWRRELFEWEKDLVKDLLARLEGRILGVTPDVWVWKPGEDGGFSSD